ncbi:MAG: DUF427 domain-containing protein [Ilumatobacter sp.]|uniref:DUF427 domain-containing protein n=1 Tax=Ilumatobacter sp. TaxID=1967498 RepID=UPI002633A392|nr:DUF427 domain-containing protein [Ilumatobacter sp.]MDJ0771395.1 DUF427 domain-containing protein [Ilumatobacter sp.]
MPEPSDVTLVEGAIHNPADPRHFMTVTPADGRRVATIADRVIADSATALVCKEVGRSIYDPVVYFPRADVDPAVLVAIDTTTHCPLKGDTEYFDVVVDGERYAAAAWSYVDLVTDNPLRGLVAFDGSQVSVG